MGLTDVGVSSIPGVRVGHWTDIEARTGCTVVRFPEATVASGDVRGGAPATREFALLDPLRRVERLDALVLTGGSAFGLASADGVVAGLEAEGIGFPTGAGPVPIVTALGLFDLAVGDSSVRPDAVAGRSALADAREQAVERGAIGAGTGCTIAKWHGPKQARGSGLGCATAGESGLRVAALVAVNALGWIDDGVDRPLARTQSRSEVSAFGNTTIGLIVTDVPLSKLQCHALAQSGHDGLARAVVPAHTSADGDALVAASVPGAPQRADAAARKALDVDLLRALGAQAVEAAIRSVVDHADGQIGTIGS